MATEVDLRNGRYRRLYEVALHGDRINAVSIGAEFWYWRLLLVVDDFGNVVADPRKLKAKAAPMRTVTYRQIERWIVELVEHGLLIRYESSKGPHLHMPDFERMQTPRNGKRIRRYDPYPGSPEIGRGNPDASRCVQIDPDASSASRRIRSISDKDKRKIYPPSPPFVAKQPEPEPEAEPQPETNLPDLVSLEIEAAMNGWSPGRWSGGTGYHELGAMVQEYGEAKVLDAIRDAVSACPNPRNALRYLRAILKSPRPRPEAPKKRPWEMTPEEKLNETIRRMGGKLPESKP